MKNLNNIIRENVLSEEVEILNYNEFESDIIFQLNNDFETREMYEEYLL